MPAREVATGIRDPEDRWTSAASLDCIFDVARRSDKLAKGGPASRLFTKAHQISSEGKDRAGKPLKVLSPKMQKVFGDFGGRISIQRSPPRWVDPRFVDKAISYIKEVE